MNTSTDKVKYRCPSRYRLFLIDCLQGTNRVHRNKLMLRFYLKELDGPGIILYRNFGQYFIDWPHV